MRTALLRSWPAAVRRFVLWCLVVAVPVFGVSGTVVELLGTNHVHRAAGAAPGGTAADPMQGWVDFRRTAGFTTTARVHPHSHSLFARHHHDRADASVVALDGGPLQGEAPDDGGGTAGSLSQVMALTATAMPALPPAPGFAWPEAASAAAMPWTAGGPLRPPKA